MSFPRPGSIVSLKTSQSESYSDDERFEDVLNVPGNTSHISDLDALQNLTVNDQRSQTVIDSRDQGASANQRRAPLCVVCEKRPQYSKAGKKYTTCGMSCAEKLQSGSGWSDTSARIPEGVRDLPYSRDDDTDDDLDSNWGVDAEAEITPDYYSDSESPSIQSLRPNQAQSKPVRLAPAYQPWTPLCIVCRKKPPYSKDGRKYPTCGLTCAEKAVSICCVSALNRQ